MENSNDTRSSNGGGVELRQSAEVKRTVGRSESVKCFTEAGAVNNDILRNKLSMSLAPLLKTKGKLYHKKRGAFSKWKEYFTFLDVPNFQLNFYKEESGHETLNTCVISVDLRFVDRVVPRKGGILSKKSCFKIYRKAGLSTVQLATQTDEERAEWITTVESLMRRIKYSPEAKIGPSMKSATLPKRHTLNFSGHQSDSDKSIPSSISEECEIKPRKISKTSFQIMTSEISGIKLKKHTQLKEPSIIGNSNSQPNSVTKSEGNGVIAFGVQLKKVDPEEKKALQSLDPKVNETEFQLKYNSLSKTKRSPNLPLSSNVKHAVSDKSLTEVISNPSPRSSPAKTQDRKTSHVSVIPLSKSVQAVVQNNPDLESAIKEKIENIDSDVVDENSETKICHAVTTEIPTFDCELKELSGNKALELPDKEDDETSPVEAPSVSKENICNLRGLSEKNFRDVHTVEEIPGYISSTPIKLISSMEVTLIKSQSPKKPPRSYSFENKTAHKKVKKMLSYSGTTELQHKIQAEQKTAKGNLAKEDNSLKGTSFENIKNNLHLIGDGENAKSVGTAKQSAVSVAHQNEESLINSQLNNNSTFNESEKRIPSVSSENGSVSKISNEIVISAITNAFEECFINEADTTDENDTERLIIDDISYCENKLTDDTISKDEISKHTEKDIYQNISVNDDKVTTITDIEIVINQDNICGTDINQPTEVPTSQREDFPIVSGGTHNIEKQVDSVSPVKIRKSYLRESIIDEDTSIKRPSAVSILSSESDDPLPKFNFMGKSERSSCNSYSFKEPLYIDEKVTEELMSDSKDVIRHDKTTTNGTKTVNTVNNIVDFSKTLLDDTNDILLNAPVIIRISDVDALNTISEDAQPKQSHNEEISKNILIAEDNNTNQSEEITSVCETINDGVDYFPTQEETSKRLDELSIETPSPVRTSGIVDLSEYLASNTDTSENEELFSGVNRLGSSVAVERLKEEVREK